MESEFRIEGSDKALIQALRARLISMECEFKASGGHEDV